MLIVIIYCYLIVDMCQYIDALEKFHDFFLLFGPIVTLSFHDILLFTKDQIIFLPGFVILVCFSLSPFRPASSVFYAIGVYYSTVIETW